MPVVISMLRGINLGAHRRVKMEELRALYQSLDLRDCETYVQSGNLIFKTDERDLVGLAKRIEAGIERRFGFHTDVIVRTPVELRKAIAKNPFAKQKGLQASKLLVTFLAGVPGKEARESLLRLHRGAEQLHLAGRELYIYFSNGMARPALSWAVVQKTLNMPATGRNCNSVTKMLEVAERLEAGDTACPGQGAGGASAKRGRARRVS